nr:ubiquitin hydrolase [Tanacetum cinerariifolium]
RIQSTKDPRWLVRNQDNTRKQGNNEDTSSKAMLAIDGVGFDWSDMAEEQVQTNMALMAFSDSEGIMLFHHPHPLIYNGPTKLDLSYSGLDEFKEHEFKGYGPRDTKKESNTIHDQKSNDSKENSDDSFVKVQVSEDTSSFVVSPLNVDKEIAFSVDNKIEFVKPKNHDKPVKKSVRYVEMYRSKRLRGNQRNWNRSRSDFVMYKKACFICGSFGHMRINCTHHQRQRRVFGNNYNRVDSNYYAKTTHPSAQRNMPPRVVLLKTSLRPFNTSRLVYTAYP